MGFGNSSKPASSDGAALASSIVDGDTTHAPDGNSVFDALALKADGTAGVKVYRALLVQGGTNAPVATVLENSLGEVPTWSYIDVGMFGFNAVATIFTQFKSAASIAPVFQAAGQPFGWAHTGDPNDANQWRVYTGNVDGDGHAAAANDILLSDSLTLFEIRVYP